MTTQAVESWKDGEVKYCRALLASNGNRSVPRDAIRSYFDVQIGDATRSKREDVAAELFEMLAAWRLNHEATTPHRSPIS